MIQILHVSNFFIDYCMDLCMHLCTKYVVDLHLLGSVTVRERKRKKNTRNVMKETKRCT
jgi:hypothetical protein